MGSTGQHQLRREFPDDGFIRAHQAGQQSIGALNMNPEKSEFLRLATLPARLNLTETAWFLGFTEHDISLLVSAKLLKPLGRPPLSGSKYFSTVELQRLQADVGWLAKASDATVNHWKKKNAGRVSKRPAFAPER